MNCAFISPASQSAFDSEQARIDAIRAEFKDAPSFATAAIIEGWTLERARIEFKTCGHVMPAKSEVSA